jgi:hypothetical protein
VGIDEARHHHPARGIDLDGVARLRQILQPAARPHFHQDSILDEQGAIVNYIEFFERRSRAGPPGASQGNQMTRTPDQYGFQVMPAPLL